MHEGMKGWNEYIKIDRVSESTRGRGYGANVNWSCGVGWSH